MPGGHRRILSPFTGCKKRKAWNKTREKYMLEERRQNLGETDRVSCYNQEEWLEEFLDDKSAFYNCSKTDDSDNDDENCNEHIEAVIHRCFSNKVFLKSFAGKHLCGSFFLMKLQALRPLKTFSLKKVITSAYYKSSNSSGFKPVLEKTVCGIFLIFFSIEFY